MSEMTLDLASLTAGGAPADVWIDTDPAAGVHERDVDDALALVQAFRSPELRLHGVSVVYGNCSLADAFPIAEELARRFAPRRVPVTRGAGRPEELGQATAAVAALAAAAYRVPLVVLALGPLTNVATFLRLHPELHERVRALIMVAGRRPGQRLVSAPTQRTPFPDFNFEQDPAAVAEILASEVPLVLAPWEVSSHLWVTAEDLTTLAAGGAAGAWIAARAQSWLGLWRREVGVDAFNPFDTLAVACVTHPALVAAEEVGIWIGEGVERAEDGRPIPQLLADRTATGGRRAIYCYKPSPELHHVILERLAGT
jgi:pyrimidine-specific ribonucleoside hydrolase